MTTFALVHGAWHGSWCWHRLIPELEDRGHGVIAVDLPSDDPAATFDDYADVVAGELEAHGEDDVVVVGHSLAGLTIPLVAVRQRVRRLIYLCALVPMPGLSFMDQFASEDMLDLGYAAGLGEPDAKGRHSWADEGLARRFLYGDCDSEAADHAVARLRPQAQSPYARPCSLDAFPDTPSTYVVCSEDRLVKPDWSRNVARERLNADLVELPGSHSPFLSRPADLANVLHDAASAPSAVR
jgi:pimeloyl-ACP methyl ester carboxylesterase